MKGQKQSRLDRVEKTLAELIMLVQQQDLAIRWAVKEIEKLQNNENKEGHSDSDSELSEVRPVEEQDAGDVGKA